MSRILIFYITVLIMASQAIVTGCTRTTVDPRLAMADSLIVTCPDQALSLLDEINVADMPENDRRLYNLLKIKAADKAYTKYVSGIPVREATASITGEYQELFTLWRKRFADTGCSKLTEIDFRNFIERIENDINVGDSVKSAIKRQAARLLLSIGKYDAAEKYLSEAIEMELLSGDSLKMIEDLHLSGGIHLLNKDFEASEKRIDAALRLSNELKSDILSAKSLVYLAAVKYCSDNIDKALMLIQKIPEKGVESINTSPRRQSAPTDRNGGLLDSALNVVKELLYPSASDSREIDNTVNTETLREHAFLPENYHVRDLLYLAVIRKASYNLILEENARITAEIRNMRLSLAISIVIMAALILVVIIIYLRYRHRCTVIELMQALESLEAIQDSLEINTETPVYPAGKEKSADEMRIELRDRLLDLYNHSDGIPVSPKILNSPVHDRLMKYIEEKKEIKHDDDMWRDIETMVLEASPLFRKNLLVLLRGHLVSYDMPTALLIKAGVTPSQMAVLLNREKGTISSRRLSLCQRIFDRKLGTKIIDGIIRLL